MSIRMRHTKAHTKNRRSHHKAEGAHLSKCQKCGKMHVRHRVCENCGTYKEKQFIDVLAKLDKKERKEKERVLKEEEESQKPLDAAGIVKKIEN